MVLRIRKFATLLLAVLTTLFVFLACSSSMSVGISNSGSGEVVLSVRKENAADIAPDRASFEAYMNEYVAKLNSESVDTDVLTVEGYEEDDTHYRVTVSTRRIDTIGGLGDIIYENTKSFCENDLKNLEKIKDGYDQLVMPSILRVYPNAEAVRHVMDPEDNPIEIKARSTDSGEILSFEDFESELRASEKDHILFFQLADLKLVDEITFELPGEVKFVSVMSDYETGEEIETVSYSGSSVTVKGTELLFSTGEKNAFFGYFVYSEGVSPWLIAGIVVGVLGLGALVYFGIIKGGIKRFFQGSVWQRVLRYKILYLLILPAFALIIMFRYMPMVWLSAGFMEYDLLQGLGSEWVGLKYFKGVFYATNTPEMYRIFRNTIFISLIRILSNLPVILFLAVLINSIKTKKLRTAFQTISFIPYFLSWVSVGGIFNAVLDPNTGMLNRMFGSTTNWYGDPDPWWAILSISSLWKGMGWSTLIYISAMCNIDTELYEACSLDGGGMMRQVFTVTIPGIMNIICLQLILDVSNIMRDNYEQILAMTNGQVTGAIQDTVDVVGRISYTALSKGNFGSATAIGLIQGVIGSILVLVTNKIVKKTENEGII
ncbi:MAG: hypothetical protein IJ514_01455 [Clostridia bacterium]|nr:hypothetical protein [Clostridia bacterium]